MGIAEFYEAHRLLSFYLLTIFIFMLFEILFLFKANWVFFKMKKKLERKNFKSGDFLTILTADYEKILSYSGQSVNTRSLVETRLEQDKSKLMRGIKYIENTVLLYVLLGFLGAVFMIAVFILGRNFEGFESIQYLIETLSTQFRAFLIAIIFGIICSVIMKILIKLFNTRGRIDKLIDKIVIHLETEVRQRIFQGGRTDSNYKESVYRLSELERKVSEGFNTIAEKLDRICLLLEADEKEKVLEEVKKFKKETEEDIEEEKEKEKETEQKEENNIFIPSSPEYEENDITT